MRTRSLIAACALGLSFPALAQDSDEALTVTATRVERPSLEIPASVDRVHAEDIRFARPQVNLSESLGRVPGIVVQNRQNYAQDLQVSSRGFGTRSTFGIRGLRLIADGIPASMPDGQGQAANFDLGTAERIEILRGPFAVMYGNASGGVINVITESGGRDPGLATDLSVGSYGTRRGALKWGGKEGALDWIVGGSRFRTDGYRDHSAARRDQTNAKLTVGLDESSTLAVVANTFDSPDTQDPLGLTRAQFEADPRQVDPVAITFNTRKTVRQYQAGVTFTHRASANTFAVSAYSGHREVRQYLSIPLFVQNGATHSGGVIDLDREYGGASLRLTRDTSFVGGPLTLTVGAEIEQMNERRKGFLNLNGDIGGLKRFEDNDVTATAGYAQAEWRFAEKWIALAGVRSNRVEFVSTDYYIVPPSNPDDSGTREFSRTTPALGIVYKLAPTASVYANAGRGFETPTFAELAYRPGGGTGLNFDLAASRSRHAELGVKAVFARARVNAALFEVETQDEIVVDSASGGRTTFKNAGRTLRRGVELGGDTRLPLGFDAAVAWTVIDATFRDEFTSGTSTVPAGNVLPGVPRSAFYGELRWRHVESGFTAGLEAHRKSRVAVNDLNTEFADAYVVTNLALGFTQRGKDWRLSEYLRVDNLRDKRYAGSVIVNDTNGRYYEPAPERNVTLGVQAKLSF